MTVDEQITLLMENRLMATHEQVLAFDNALYAEVPEPTHEETLRLFLVFDDASDDHEVMFGLIHYMDGVFPKEPARLYVEAFLQALPELVVGGSEWARILMCRFLNDDPSRTALEGIVRNRQEGRSREALVKVLRMDLGSSEFKRRSAADLLATIQSEL